MIAAHDKLHPDASVMPRLGLRLTPRGRLLLEPAPDAPERKGLVLATLMRLKQICNHPSQWLDDNDGSHCIV